MSQPRPWVEEVIIALTDLGGVAELSNIYARISDRADMDFEANPNWESAVRNALERHSSDSAIFNGKRDLFYSLDGIGQGVWGLRSMVSPTSSAE